MAKTRLLFTTMLILTIIISSCKKEVVKCSNDKEFCDFIDKEQYNETGSLINEYFRGQKKNLSESEKLEKTRAWLTCKSCVSRAEILCNSCIKTNPPQSEIKVWFTVNGQEVVKVLDIIMDKPLKFRTFHD